MVTRRLFGSPRGLLFVAVLALPWLFVPALSGDAAPTLADQERGAAAKEEADGKAEVATLVGGMNAFGGSMYSILTNRDDAEANLFFSPYSVHRALGLVYPGARGRTAEEIREVLRIELETERYIAAAAALEAKLTRRHERSENMPEDWEPSKLRIANAAWHDESLPFRQDYLDRLTAHFDLPVRPADFRGQPEEERERINRWVAEKTNDLIEELIPQGAIDDLTRYVLTNAVYFLAQWETQFQESNTRERTFTTINGDEVQMPMMHGEVPARFTQEEDYLVLELPYRLSNQAMTILFPEKGKLAELERRLAEGEVFESFDSLRSGRVRLAMPRFSMTSEFSLNSILEEMGMPEAFTPAADFSGMTDEDEIEITSVLHEATIDLDEEGTEAAAATAVVMGLRSAPSAPDLEVTLDRPFLFLIRDTKTDAAIFLGRLADQTD